MDWIEKIFHVSPDGGSGLTEMLILGGLVLVVGSASIRLVMSRARRRRRRSSGGSRA